MSLLYPYLCICKFPDGRAGDVRLLRVRRTLFTRITLPAEAVLPRKPVRAMAKLNRTHYSYKITGVTPVAMKFPCQGLELTPSGSAADVECNEPPQPRAQPLRGKMCSRRKWRNSKRDARKCQHPLPSSVPLGREVDRWLAKCRGQASLTVGCLFVSCLGGSGCSPHRQDHKSLRWGFAADKTIPVFVSSSFPPASPLATRCQPRP